MTRVINSLEIIQRSRGGCWVSLDNDNYIKIFDEGIELSSEGHIKIVGVDLIT